MSKTLRINPQVGQMHMTESRILPTGTHRVKFTQRGQVPNMEALKEKCKVNDGRYVICAAWMDEHGIGHAYLAWKEKSYQAQIT